MMKAGHLMTMTRNNGERCNGSFNSRTNRSASQSSPTDSSASYNYGQRSGDANFESEVVLGRTSEEDANVFLSRENSKRKQHSPPETSTAPSSPRLSNDTLLSASTSPIGRSASLRSSRGRDSGKRDERTSDKQTTTSSRFPRRCGSARDSSSERRRAEFAFSSESYRYHERQCGVSNINYKLHPPPKIVTTIDEPGTSDDRFPITPSSETGSDGSFTPTHWSKNKRQHLLSVPDYDSPPQLLSPTFDDQSATRSRSRSTPAHPDISRGGRKSVHQTKSDACSDNSGVEDGDMYPADRLYNRRSTAENYDYYHHDRPVIDRRVSYNAPMGAEDVDERALAAAYRDKTRKYSCAEVRVSNDRMLLSAKTGSRAQQTELRRLASSGAVSSETPRRRFLPPTPDELIRRRQQQEKDSDNFSPQASGPSYLEVDYGGSKKPFLLSSSSLPGSAAGEERDPASSSQLSYCRPISSGAGGGFLKDNEGRTCATTGPGNKTLVAPITRDGGAAMITRSPASSNAARPGSGRKLPAEPTPTALEPSSPENVDRMLKPGSAMEEYLKSSSSDEAESDWPSPPHTSVATPSSEGTSKTTILIPSNRCASGNQGLLKKFHQSSVSTSSSVPDFQITPSPNAPPNSGPAVSGAHNADAATDSGHGSGAESAVGDGTTVSASNSWPDAIVSGVTSTAKSPSTPGASLISVIQTSNSVSRRSSATISPPPSPSIGSVGLLHFSLQYFPVRKRLRISVIKADFKIEAELNAFVKICLVPGKLQKQKGERIVKRSKEATFNEEFFFDSITTEDVEAKSVNVRLCHHVGKQFQKDVVIGQTEVTLKDFLPILLGKQEVKLCQELKPKQLKKLGRLQISTCLEKDARRLTINIFKADDLPKFGITGPPDPFVRITVDQNGWVQTKQSRTLKSTCNAVFKEAVMFLVSTKISDLERTKITITIHDACRTSSGDDVIGHVFLGQLASDKVESEQWKNSIAHFGREFKATHQLKLECNATSVSEDGKERISEDD